MRNKFLPLIILALGLSTGQALADPPAGKHLPPGLQKKAARGEALPPGWQKKLHVGDKLDQDIYARGKVVVPVGDDGVISIEVDGTFLKLRARTREILRIGQ